MSDESVNDALFNAIKKAAEEKGLDPDRIKKEDLNAEKRGGKVHVKWRDVEVEVPAPSQESIDTWFKKNGQVIAGSLLTLGAVAVGGAIAIAAAASARDS